MAQKVFKAALKAAAFKTHGERMAALTSGRLSLAYFF
jgi:hypothetical protein